MAACIKDEREPTANEMAQFDEICDSLIPAWQTELSYANKYEQAIVAMSKSKNALRPNSADYGDDRFEDIYEWRNSRP